MERVPMRDGYGKALLELCRLHDDVLVLDADVAKIDADRMDPP